MDRRPIELPENRDQYRKKLQVYFVIDKKIGGLLGHAVQSMLSRNDLPNLIARIYAPRSDALRSIFKLGYIVRGRFE